MDSEAIKIDVTRLTIHFSFLERHFLLQPPAQQHCHVHMDECVGDNSPFAQPATRDMPIVCPDLLFSVLNGNGLPIQFHHPKVYILPHEKMCWET